MNDARLERQEGELEKLLEEIQLLYNKVRDQENRRAADMEALRRRYDPEILRLKTKLDSLNRLLPNKRREVEMTREQVRRAVDKAQKEQANSNFAPNKRTGTYF